MKEDMVVYYYLKRKTFNTNYIGLLINDYFGVFFSNFWIKLDQYQSLKMVWIKDIINLTVVIDDGEVTSNTKGW